MTIPAHAREWCFPPEVVCVSSDSLSCAFRHLMRRLRAVSRGLVSPPQLEVFELFRRLESQKLHQTSLFERTHVSDASL
jgi:hypothetical protein